jgi:hypothetical protein
MLLKIESLLLCVEAHACNPSYLGGGDHEAHNSMPALSKSYQDPISTNKKLSVVACTYHPATG